MHKLNAAAAAATLALLLPTTPALASQVPTPQPTGWLVSSYDELKSPTPTADLAAEIDKLKAMAAKRTDDDLTRLRWWSVGGPAYRWNEIAIGAILDDFVVMPMAARHLALIHAAMDDAVAAAWIDKQAYHRPRPSEADSALKPAIAVPAGPSYPSDYAAAATAAAEVLSQIFPARAAEFSARATEAMTSRLMAGVEYPSDVAAGSAIGRKAAALAIARGKADGSDVKWAGTIPEGPGHWKGTNPISPATAKWQPWVLARQEEFRPPPPPPYDSEATKAALAELKQVQRVPKITHRAIYWETFGGARSHALYNETARMKLLEYADMYDPPKTARALATLNIALMDSVIACWDAKYAYWYIRPSQLDPELKSVFPPPNHPSYPAAHGCLTTAAATVLAGLFPGDRERLLAQGKEAAEARVLAGIHYRFDIDAGQELGRKVGEKVIARAFVKQSN